MIQIIKKLLFGGRTLQSMLRSVVSHSFVFTLLWLGFVLAISFMEAWVKFRAPSISMAQGLDVGRQVFSALSWVERGFCFLLLLQVCFFPSSTSINILIGLLTGLLILQGAWLLPALDQRALVYISGGTPVGKSPHIYYIIAEVMKVILLAWLGLLQIVQFKTLA